MAASVPRCDACCATNASNSACFMSAVAAMVRAGELADEGDALKAL